MTIKSIELLPWASTSRAYATPATYGNTIAICYTYLYVKKWTDDDAQVRTTVSAAVFVSSRKEYIDGDVKKSCLWAIQKEKAEFDNRFRTYIILYIIMLLGNKHIYITV